MLTLMQRAPADVTRTLVVVFLRGGADGLTLVPPIGDDAYHRARPRLRVSPREALVLDGFFGLHPRLGALARLFAEGTLAIVHASGSEDATRSHFEAQDLMEHGGAMAGGGWLGRFLRERSRRSTGGLPAVAVGSELPLSLRGAPSATVMRELDDLALDAAGPSLVRELERLYAADRGSLGAPARNALALVRRIDHLRRVAYSPAHGAAYPDDVFAAGLAQIARLIRAGLGLEAASIDLGGWDSHIAQGTTLDPLMARLGTALAAFSRDLGTEHLATTTVVVMTEFGRRVGENASFGTDHGRGSAMFVMGGGVRGGRVIANWPGLGDDRLEGPGDLAVTTNYRDVLAPILARHGDAAVVTRAFPGFEGRPVDLFG
jgi:uncharacterized protein (DUF1501 family)